MSENGKHDEGEKGWFERPENANRIWYALLAIAALLLIAELFYEHHPHFGIDGLPGFYAIFGFVSFIVIVFAGKFLRTIIMRDEDYYERD